MPQTFPPDFKCCAMCDFWGGERKLNVLKDQITIDSLSVKGKCLLQGGPWKGWDMGAVFNCGQWVRWIALR